MSDKPRKTTIKAKPSKSKKVRQPKPFEDAPFGVDTSEDGDMVTPRIDLDEQEIKEQGER